MYLDPSPPHSYLLCRVNELRDLYPLPHMTHRNLRSPGKPPSIAGLTVNIQGGFFTFGFHQGRFSLLSSIFHLFSLTFFIRFLLISPFLTFTTKWNNGNTMCKQLRMKFDDDDDDSILMKIKFHSSIYGPMEYFSRIIKKALDDYTLSYTFSLIIIYIYNKTFLFFLIEICQII